MVEAVPFPPTKGFRAQIQQLANAAYIPLTVGFLSHREMSDVQRTAKGLRLLLCQLALFLCDLFGLFGAGTSSGLLILGFFCLNASDGFSFECLFRPEVHRRTDNQA